MQYQDPEKKRKLLLIGGSVAAALLILIVGIWAVSAAVNSLKSGYTIEPVETPVAVTDQTTSETTDDARVTEQTAPVIEDTTKTTQAMPTTGPSEVFLTAILMGVATSLVVKNLQLVKNLEKRYN